MYLPYVRGRQYELLAIKELVSQGLIGKYVLPIVEPVKLSPTLINTMAECINKESRLAVIRNPEVGAFLSDLEEAQDDSREAGYVGKFNELYSDERIINTVIMGHRAKEVIDNWEQNGIDKGKTMVVCLDRDYLDEYMTSFGNAAPQYTLIPDESAFRRKVHNNRILLSDHFPKKERNSDYKDAPDDFFSDDHLYYIDDQYIGFSDYSIVGTEYMEAGFAPYAIAIHIVYFAEDKTLRVKHFVSDSNDDISNPALKYYEAVSKLNAWYESEKNIQPLTKGLSTFLRHYQEQSYPGLGTVKKLSLMHHFELMERFLCKEDH